MDRASISQIYRLEPSRRPWGDYGSILFDGLLDLRESDGLVQLDRTGPFVPPISFPGHGVIVLTDAMQSEMKAAKFRGITFRPVEKRKIVELHWESWDQQDRSPLVRPVGGEPENYILEGKHSALASLQIGDLWQVVTEHSAKVTRITSARGNTRFEYVSGSWNGNDFFSVEENYYVYCSLRAKKWLESCFRKWCKFSAVK